MQGPFSNHSLSGSDRDQHSPEELRRHFSDRERFIQIFERQLIQSPTVPVLMFHGLGGIGKTYLMRYLMYEYGRRWTDATKGYPHAFLSFRSGHTPTSTERALWQAREQLIRTKRQITFPRFDLLWGKFWERTEKVPISQNKDLIPGWVASIGELLQPFGVSIPIGAINFFGYHIKTFIIVRRMSSWLRNKIEIPMKVGWKIALQTIELKELVALFPIAFAADLAESATRLTPPYNRIVLFVDNYEALQEQLGEAFGREANNFVQELAKELVELNANVLLIVAGRDQLRWGEVRRRDGIWVLDPASLWAQEVVRREAQVYSSRFLEQRCVGELSEADAREYLAERYQLTDPDIINEIYEFTGGFPLALGVAADLITEAGGQVSIDFNTLRTRVATYEPLSEEWRLEVNDWLFERLLEQLKINGREDLVSLTKAAAIPRWFNQELLFALTRDRGISEQFRRLVGYSFVEPYEVEEIHSYRLHSIVRKIIRQNVDIHELSEGWEKTAIDWFASQVGKISSKSKWRYNFEIVYHLWHLEPHQAMQKVENWFAELQSSGEEELCWELLNTAAEVENSLPLHIQVQINLYRSSLHLSVWHKKGTNREQALQYAEKAVVQAENGVNERLRADAYNAASHVLMHMAMGVSADPRYYFSRAIQMLRRQCEVAESVNDRCNLAQGLLSRAGIETDLNPDYGNFSLIDQAIDLYQQEGEIHGQRDAYFDKAILAMRLEQWDLVAPSLTKAAELDQQLPSDILREAHTFQVWGEYYAQRKQLEAANNSLEKAKIRYEQLHFIHGICAATGWLGIVQCYTGDMAGGLGLVREALRIERDILGSQEGAAKWLHYVGELFMSLNAPKRALQSLWLSELLREALNHTEVTKTKEKISEIRKLMDANVFERLMAEFQPRKSEFGEYAFLWGFDSFRKYEANPILLPRGKSWESLTVYNPAAWTDNDKVYLLYRAEGPCDFPDKAFTSRIGLAISQDGIDFKREPLPVMEPTESYEIPGGCEDPRLVQIDNVFYMTYTAYDGKTARLSMARSRDLHRWEKLGPLFPDEQWERYFPHEEHNSLFPKGWSKSGAILNHPINGYYWMYFGDTQIWAAYSKDLISWEVVDEPVLSPRPNTFDSRLVEPGPPPLLLPEGIWLGYNGADSNLQYAFGQALFATDKPTKLIRRSTRPLLLPTTESEKTGQVPQVVFGEGLVRFHGKWFLYYGMADSRIGVAIAESSDSDVDQE